MLCGYSRCVREVKTREGLEEAGSSARRSIESLEDIQYLSERVEGWPEFWGWSTVAFSSPIHSMWTCYEEQCNNLAFSPSGT